QDGRSLANPNASGVCVPCHAPSHMLSYRVGSSSETRRDGLGDSPPLPWCDGRRTSAGFDVTSLEKSAGVAKADTPNEGVCRPVGGSLHRVEDLAEQDLGGAAEGSPSYGEHGGVHSGLWSKVVGGYFPNEPDVDAACPAREFPGCGDGCRDAFGESPLHGQRRAAQVGSTAAEQAAQQRCRQ